MQFKLLLLIGFFVCTNYFFGQKSYEVGKEVDDSLASFHWFYYGECYDGFHDTDLTFPDSEVTGVKHVLIITALETQGGFTSTAYTDLFGVFKVGDTLFLDGQNHVFYCPESVTIKGVIKAVGIPEVEGETYKCGKIYSIEAMSHCFAWIAYDFEETGEPITQCQVQPEGCSTEEFVSEQICGSLTWNNTTYDKSGTYNQVLTSVEGCDSIVVLDLTVFELYNSKIYNTFCDEYIYDDISYTETGVYTLIYEDLNGCDSTIMLNLTISTADDIDNTISQDDNTLTANSSYASYQWYDCTNDLLILDGETDYALEASSNGWYAVEISDGTCSRMSNCIEVNTLGLENNAHELADFTLYPNPSTKYFQLNHSSSNLATIRVLDVLGNLILERSVNSSSTLINHDLSAGVYFVGLYDQAQLIAVKRLVVK